MARAPQIAPDPSADAAALLRRMGFVVLMVGVPLASLFARRSTVLLVPIGVSLLVLASLLDGRFRPLRDVVARLAGSSGSVAFGLGLVWIGISLLWARGAADALERALNLAGTLGVALLGYLALPDRMRSANLYLLPVGVALAAVVALALALGWSWNAADLDDDKAGLGRGLTLLALFVWPAIAWLRSRERDLEAFGLGVLVATATVAIGGRTMLPLVLAAGAFVYSLASFGPRAAATAVAITTSALVMLVPVVALLGPAALSGPGRVLATAPLDIVRETAASWHAVFAADPLRLLTGHGIGAFFNARVSGILPAGTGTSALLQVWYDLGFVGALVAAAALWSGPRAAVTSYAPLSSGVTAAFATGYALALAGIGNGQMWLLTGMTVLVLAFVAGERGQFRTQRPRALIFGARRPAGR